MHVEFKIVEHFDKSEMEKEMSQLWLKGFRLYGQLQTPLIERIIDGSACFQTSYKILMIKQPDYSISI
jgi:hypothetical protein